MALPASQVLLVPQVWPATIHQSRCTRTDNASGAHKDHPAHLVPPAQPVLLAPRAALVLPVDLAKTAVPARLVPLVKPALLARMVPLDPQATKVPMLPEAARATLEPPEAKETLDPLVETETAALQAKLAELAHLDQPEQPARVAKQAARDHLAQPDKREAPAQMPSIVLAPTAPRNTKQHLEPNPFGDHWISDFLASVAPCFLNWFVVPMLPFHTFCRQSGHQTQF